MHNKKPIAPQLLENIRSYNLNLPNPAVANIDLLKDSKTLVVATGQQVGIYISPVLAVYKALTAIKLAEQFQKDFKVPVVPLFWLQTEDHDFDEIRTTTLLDQQGFPIQFELMKQDGKIPISERKISEHELTELNNKISDVLSGYPAAEKVFEFINYSYGNNNDLALAFAKLMSSILGNCGLIFLDPVRTDVSKFAAEIYKGSVNNFSLIAKTLRENSNPTSQVALRDNATLFFYRDTDERERLVKIDDSTYSLSSNKKINQDKLINEIETSPYKFSASALLRPIIQDYILPTIAYVGGAAEIEYLKQCQPLYPIFNIIPAKAIKRPSITIIDKKFTQWLDEIDIKIEDLRTEKLDVLLADKLLDPKFTPENLQKFSTEKINIIFDELENAVKLIDKTLLNSAVKARERSNDSIKILIEKYSKAAILKDKVWQDRMNRVKNSILPYSKSQERIISACYFYAKYGDDFIINLKNSINPEHISNDIELTL